MTFLKIDPIWKASGSQSGKKYNKKRRKNNKSLNIRHKIENVANVKNILTVKNVSFWKANFEFHQVVSQKIIVNNCQRGLPKCQPQRSTLVGGVENKLKVTFSSLAFYSSHWLAKL